MGQYNRIKSKYPDAILLFRVGDFYETFSQDAILTANTLGIVLTKRANGAASHIELAGFPHHALDTYLPKLVKAGYRVAICDQLEDPKLTKKIVKRGVTELVTPGVAINDKILDHKANNYLAAIAFIGHLVGIAFLDVSTGEFLVAEGDTRQIDKLLQSFNPSEIILAKPAVNTFKKTFGSSYYTYPLEDWVFYPDYGREKLLTHFGTVSLKGFGVDRMEAATTAAGACLHYLGETEHPKFGHITSIARIAEANHVWLDRFTIRNLELFSSQYEDGTSLLDIMDHTISPMGARMMKRWVAMPLKEKKAIDDRLLMVETLIKDQELEKLLEQQLKQIGDLERLVSKIPLGRVNPRELMQLSRSLQAILPVRESCMLSNCKPLIRLAKQMDECQEIREKISQTLVDDPPAQIQKGGVIRKGVSETLDELRTVCNSSKELMLEMQQKEALATGISSLKIGYNNVFGYYLEVTNAHKSKVPAEWTRKQTLVNAERYITNELKAFEDKIMGAEEKILALETSLFNDLVESLMLLVQPVQVNAQVVAQIDCLLSFARNAQKNNYRKPDIDEQFVIDIKGGRHPVIEKQLPPGEKYVPNDIYLDTESQQVIVITGPNMAGKSALLRQTALIVLMAQIGSFVPADAAIIGLVDKIFTRVGASDNISSGESTFMVEMNETASIVNNISPRSLILLDEIGRGTSTFDGISIAWALAEFLHNHPTVRAKTLFATHYHELTEMAERYDRIRNYSISTKEHGNKVIFLRKLVPGGTKHSFGIHVARMAGMPGRIVERANEIMQQLEQKSLGSDLSKKLKTIPQQPVQLNIFNPDHPQWIKISEVLNGIDINTLTPLEALMKLNELKKIVNNQ